MGVPTSEVGYTPAMPRREDHEVHKGHVVALDTHTQNIFAPVTFGASVKHSSSIQILLLVGFCAGSDEVKMRAVLVVLYQKLQRIVDLN